MSTFSQSPGSAFCSLEAKWMRRAEIRGLCLPSIMTHPWHFKAQAVQRAKSEKEANAFIQITKEKTRAKRRARQKAENPGRHPTPACNMEETTELRQAEENRDKCGDAKLEADNPLPELALSKPKTRRCRVTKTADNEDEFRLADTFDFRKYLPKNLLKEDAEDISYLDENDVDLDFEEEELGNAILEGGFGKDPEESCSDSDKQGKKMAFKKKQDIGSSEAPGVTNSDCNKKRRRRGGRRYHKKCSTAPRVIILSGQDTANAIRRRADDFVNQRLFGITTSVGKPPRAPRRMTPQEMSQMAAKVKARRLALRERIGTVELSLVDIQVSYQSITIRREGKVT
uniref:Expressed conserved protein n=1 Tax=Echinococcus granulosus TaxID=6210 RepID=A0A068X0X2_ECHGR|nr:expressed conserved protein [Echinococcus granulosus]